MKLFINTINANKLLKIQIVKMYFGAFQTSILVNLQIHIANIINAKVTAICATTFGLLFQTNPKIINIIPAKVGINAVMDCGTMDK